MVIKALTFISFLFLFSCIDRKGKENAPIPFDQDKWALKEGSDYPHRDLMLSDLMENKIRKLDSIGIINLLGEPDRIDNRHLFYMIEQQRLGLWPLHTKTMVVKLTNQRSIEWVKIHE